MGNTTSSDTIPTEVVENESLVQLIDTPSASSSSSSSSSAAISSPNDITTVDTSVSVSRLQDDGDITHNYEVPHVTRSARRASRRSISTNNRPTPSFSSLHVPSSRRASVATTTIHLSPMPSSTPAKRTPTPSPTAAVTQLAAGHAGTSLDVDASDSSISQSLDFSAVFLTPMSSPTKEKQRDKLNSSGSIGTELTPAKVDFSMTDIVQVPSLNDSGSIDVSTRDEAATIVSIQSDVDNSMLNESQFLNTSAAALNESVESSANISITISSPAPIQTSLTSPTTVLQQSRPFIDPDLFGTTCSTSSGVTIQKMQQEDEEQEIEIEEDDNSEEHQEMKVDSEVNTSNTEEPATAPSLFDSHDLDDAPTDDSCGFNFASTMFASSSPTTSTSLSFTSALATSNSRLSPPTSPRRDSDMDMSNSDTDGFSFASVCFNFPPSFNAAPAFAPPPPPIPQLMTPSPRKANSRGLRMKWRDAASASSSKKQGESASTSASTSSSKKRLNPSEKDRSKLTTHNHTRVKSLTDDFNYHCIPRFVKFTNETNVNEDEEGGDEQKAEGTSEAVVARSEGIIDPPPTSASSSTLDAITLMFSPPDEDSFSTPDISVSLRRRSRRMSSSFEHVAVNAEVVTSPTVVVDDAPVTTEVDDESSPKQQVSKRARRRSSGRIEIPMEFADMNTEENSSNIPALEMIVPSIVSADSSLTATSASSSDSSTPSAPILRSILKVTEFPILLHPEPEPVVLRRSTRARESPTPINENTVVTPTSIAAATKPVSTKKRVSASRKPLSDVSNLQTKI